MKVDKTRNFMAPAIPAPPRSGGKPEWRVPTDRECERFWDDYAMPEHIRQHSQMVAKVATFMGQKALGLGFETDVQSVRASALLHDLAKHYTILYGGNHSQLGGAWVMDITGNPAIAQGVTHHVYWPFEPDVEKYFLPLVVLYADKRISHDKLVNIPDRFEDLVERYGQTEEIKVKIGITEQQALEIEKAFNRFLGVELNECTFDSGRLV